MQQQFTRAAIANTQAPPLSVYLVVVIAVAVQSPAWAQNWEPIFESEDLLVQRRTYTGSALQEMKGVMRLHTSLNAVMALLKDADFNHHWVYRSGGAKVLKQIGYEQAYVYGVVDAPWPMRDRDAVVRFDYRQHPQTRVITISISNFPEFIAHKQDLVRVPDFGGFWKLRPEKDGWVQVTYQVYGDPGGWIPVWVANYAAAKSVTRTLQNMRWAVKRYGNARSEFVQEAVQPQ